jgi:hypothetical protein
MPTKAQRPANDRAASRAALIDEIANLRAIRTDVRAALQALPAAASRTAAQKRDAATFKAVLALTRTVLALAGEDTADDRTVGSDRS